MPLNALGYVGIRSDKLDDWATYGPQFLGLELVERTAGMLKFRMDDRKQRIIVSSEADAAHTFGWEVDDTAALDALAGRLDAAKIDAVRVPADALAMRAVTAAIRFADPAGNCLEAFCGPEQASTPFKSGRPISGFRTGALGMGHVVLHVPRIEDLRWFYEDVLGFRLSDYCETPFRACFFHVNSRHHSLAMIETGRSGIHHVMMELLNLDDVGQGYDLALRRARAHRHLARPPHQRFHDVVLRQEPERVHDRIRLGRPLHRPGDVAAARDAPRPLTLGPRARLAAGRAARRGARLPDAGGARGSAPTRPSRRRQLPHRRQFLRLVGGHEAAAIKRLSVAGC